MHDKTGGGGGGTKGQPFSLGMFTLDVRESCITLHSIYLDTESTG